MEESEWRIEVAAGSDLPDDAIVRRILESPGAYRRWASEHNFLLGMVARQPRVDGQVKALRSQAMNLIHRKALYGYLQGNPLTGRKRRRLFRLFYGYRDYTNAVLAEHGNYVRCYSSLVCTEYLAEHLMHDAVVADALALYEERYAEYFRAFCDGELAETEEERIEAEPLDALRPLLKLQLAEARTAILAMPVAPNKAWREVEIRRPTGETQRLRALYHLMPGEPR